jgi:hypothetical protein
MLRAGAAAACKLAAVGGTVTAWDAIDYAPAPAGRLVAPEAHWPFVAAVEMTEAQRVAMNRLALRFSCEMVTHFERYIVDYLEQHRGRLHGALSDRAARVFADDERAHIAGFLRLLHALEPDEYPGAALAFFRWSALDEAVVRLAPAVTFFVATELLEEMFLHLHHDLEEHPGETLPLARAVMALHAREEKSHLSMDDRVLRARAAVLPAWRFALEAIASLAIVAVVDRKTSRAWRRAVEDRAARLGLTGDQVRRLARKRLSRSDVRGLRAWIERRRRAPFPGSGLLCAALERALP